MVETALCPNCHKSIPADAILCPYCGTKFEKSDKALCPQCEKEIPADALLCPYCGAKFGRVEPGRFIPPSLTKEVEKPKTYYHKHMLELEYSKGRNISFYGFLGFIFILIGAISYLATIAIGASGVGGGGGTEALPGELAALMYFSIYLGILKLLMMVMALIFAGYVALQSKKHLQAVASCLFVVGLEALSTFYAFLTLVLYTLYMLGSGSSGSSGGGGSADISLILTFTAMYITMYMLGAMLILHDYEIQKDRY